jgi:MFS family permease
MARSPKAWDIVRVSTGNFLEMYDFMVFGYYAPSIAKTFFPSGSEFLSLMLSLATFGAGFLMRPLGAILLGSYLDHHGRRKGLILTLGLMAAGTLSIAVTPSYARIGLLAPMLVVAGRLVQGFSAGVELGGVSVYLAEIATPGHKGFFVSWQSASQQPAVMLAAAFGIVLGHMLPAAAMDAWGWRIPLLAGCVLIPFVYRMRRTLPETDEFLARRRHPDPREIMRTLAANWRIVALGTMLSTMTTVSFYMITAYTPTFGSTVLHLAGTGNLTVTVCVGMVNLMLLPSMGALSDRIGRRPVLLACTGMALVTAYPAMLWLVSAPSFARLMTVELWLASLYASYNGAMVAYLTELMPLDVRTSGFALAYSLATAIFGGFTPAICTWLIHATSNRAVPGAWLSLAAAIGLTAALRTGRGVRAREYQEVRSGGPAILKE